MSQQLGNRRRHQPVDAGIGIAALAAPTLQREVDELRERGPQAVKTFQGWLRRVQSSAGGTGGGQQGSAGQKAPEVAAKVELLHRADRKAHGLGPLAWSICLYNVAVSNARRIAAQGSLSHTNGPQLDLTCRLGNHAGENIGYWSQGINDTLLNNMFMNSPEHYANIMGPYHYVATAWVVAPNGYGYIAVEFS